MSSINKWGDVLSCVFIEDTLLLGFYGGFEKCIKEDTHMVRDCYKWRDWSVNTRSSVCPRLWVGPCICWTNVSLLSKCFVGDDIDVGSPTKVASLMRHSHCISNKLHAIKVKVFQQNCTALCCCFFNCRIFYLCILLENSQLDAFDFPCVIVLSQITFCVDSLIRGITQARGEGPLLYLPVKHLMVK